MLYEVITGYYLYVHFTAFRAIVKPVLYGKYIAAVFTASTGWHVFNDYLCAFQRRVLT